MSVGASFCAYCNRRRDAGQAVEVLTIRGPSSERAVDIVTCSQVCARRYWLDNGRPTDVEHRHDVVEATGTR